MSEKALILSEQLGSAFGAKLQSNVVDFDEVTIEVAAENLLEVCEQLRDDNKFLFEELIDVCGVDYSEYGITEWNTDDCTSSGFSRGVDGTTSGRLRFGDELEDVNSDRPRFASVIHLLSLENNRRLRIRTYAADDNFPQLPSVRSVWNAADWFERESFDLYGIIYEGHPDLRRILTDYGFIGHPFRKDFPLVGNVEMRYDPEQQRVIYEPVSIEPRVLVPRVIRDDNRYFHPEEEQAE